MSGKEIKLGASGLPKKLEGYVFGSLRKIWRWSPMRREALQRAFHCTDDEGTEFYNCALCANYSSQKLVHVDHIEPVAPTTGWAGWDVHFERLFCPSEGLQVVCKDCHKAKTNKENTKRRKQKRVQVASDEQESPGRDVKARRSRT